MQEVGNDLDIVLAHVARPSARTCRDGYHRGPVRTRRQRLRFLWVCVSNWERGRLGARVRTVDGDAHEIADLLDLAASEPDRAQIPEDKVVVSAASLQSVTVADERSGQGARVGNHLLSVFLELRLGRLEKCSGDAGNGLFLDA